VKGRLLLDVIIREGAAVFKLLAGENETLLVWGNTFLILDLLLDIIDGVGRLDLEGDGLAGKGLDENLHGWANAVNGTRTFGMRVTVVVGRGWKREEKD